MSYRTPAQITAFIDEHQYKMDVPQQWYGDEPNSYGERAGGPKSWDKTKVRACIFACWAYEQAAGNQAIPLVYKSINEHSPDLLCDRSYFPSTPRDLRLMEKNGIPIFGIEHRHQLMDHDVIGTSISYPVLSINFIKQLMMADIPPLWDDWVNTKTGRSQPGRIREPERWPFVMVGGQGFGAPEVLANIADVIFCGESEDEPGNPGVGAILERILDFKEADRWNTDREECYRSLAKEFSFLYFPRYVETHYAYEDRLSIANALDDPAKNQPSKQVVGITSKLPGMKVPIVKRFVKNLDDVKALDNPPLLFEDPGMGSGDLETQRGCPAWCSFCFSSETEFITSLGVRKLGDAAGETVEVWTDEGWRKGDVRSFGIQKLRRITFGPADRGTHAVYDFCRYGHPREVDGLNNCRACKRVRERNRYYTKTGALDRIETLIPVRGRRKFDGLSGWRSVGKSSFKWEIRATADHRWVLVDGTDTQNLVVGDIIPAEAQSQVFDQEEYTQAFVHGFIFGDGSRVRMGKSYKVRLFGEKDEKRAGQQFAASLEYGESFGVQVRSLRRGHHGDLEATVHSSSELKRLPKSPSSDYASGFLSGWMAADAWQKPAPNTWCLDSIHPAKGRGGVYEGDLSAEEWLRTFASLAGWVLIGASSQTSATNFGPRTAPLRRLTLARPDAHGWVVQNIEEDVEEEVFCLVVPGPHTFTLASGALTGQCALTYRQKPYRQRSVEFMVDFGKQLTRNTGGIHVAPFGPDFPMHTQKKRLIKSLLEEVTDDIDASSMRVDDFIADPSYILLQAHGGMDTVTLGVEGNSQRMRDLVGKGAADEDVKEAVARGIQAGIRKFKLYMIASLPGEDEGDIYRILNLAKELADIRDSMGSTARIQFSWTPLLIEGNTPFQWFQPTHSNYALGDVWEEFRDLKIDFKLGGKAQKDKITYFQATQRASREVGKAMAEVVATMGQGTWGGAPRGLYEGLVDNLVAHGFHNGLADVYDEREKHDMFGWEHIDQGINVELMWVTYQQMKEFLENTDSATYDEAFDDDYHGNEWIERCDTKCYGKSQPLGAKVLTPEGFVEMGMLAVGDAVIDPLGEASVVTGVYPQGALDVYEVTFSDGSRTRTSADHLWTVLTRRGSTWTEKTIATQELLDFDSVRLVETPGLMTASLGSSDLSLDPYLLGLLIGDCSMTSDHTPVYGTADDALIDAVKELLPDGVVARQVSDKPNNFKEYALTSGNVVGLGRTHSPLVTALRNLELYGSKADTKHVPVVYKNASASARLAVLQGLIDTDGNAMTSPSQVEFVSKSERLRDDVLWLARSLGFMAKGSPRKAVKSFGKTYGPYYRAFIYRRPWLLDLARLERKLKAFPEEGFKKSYGRRVVSVAPVGREACQCIKVSATSNLYVTDDFIPTHNTCGVCDAEDLQIRRSYIQGAAEEISVDLNNVKVIDQKSVAMKLRAKVVKSDDKRFVMNDHFRYAIRRAAYRAEMPIAKRTVKFVTDNLKFKDWTSGADFLEFGITRKLSTKDLKPIVARMNEELGDSIQIVDWAPHPASADPLRTDVDLSLYEMELDVNTHTANEAIRKWNESDNVVMKFKEETRQTGTQIEEVNGKNYVDDMWLVKDGHRLLIRMLTRGKANPYVTYQALFGKASWVEAAKYPGTRVEAFVEADENVIDFFRPVCIECEKAIPVNLLDRPYDSDYCPRCKDETDGRIVELVNA